MAAEPHQPTDEEIIARVLAGESRAFETLVERHKRQVAAIVVRKVPRQEAPEVVHQVFIKAYVSLSGYRPLKPFSHWLSTLAVRACHDFWRERYRNKEIPQAALDPEPGGKREREAEVAGAESAPDPYEAFEAWELLDWALGHLSPDDRMALTLVHLEDYTLAEAAEALGWTQAAVKLRVFRARRKLRKIIAASLNKEVEDGTDEQ